MPHCFSGPFFFEQGVGMFCVWDEPWPLLPSWSFTDCSQIWTHFNGHFLIFFFIILSIGLLYIFFLAFQGWERVLKITSPFVSCFSFWNVDIDFCSISPFYTWSPLDRGARKKMMDQWGEGWSGKHRRLPQDWILALPSFCRWCEQVVVIKKLLLAPPSADRGLLLTFQVLWNDFNKIIEFLLTPQPSSGFDVHLQDFPPFVWRCLLGEIWGSRSKERGE